MLVGHVLLCNLHPLSEGADCIAEYVSEFVSEHVPQASASAMSCTLVFVQVSSGVFLHIPSDLRPRLLVLTRS